MLAQVIQAFLLCASGQIAYIYFYTCSLAVAVGNNLRQLGAHAAAELQLLSCGCSLPQPAASKVSSVKIYIITFRIIFSAFRYAIIIA